MKWAMYLAGMVVGGCVGFIAAQINATKKQNAQAKQTQVVIQELAGLRGEMHATQQERWRY